SGMRNGQRPFQLPNDSFVLRRRFAGARPVPLAGRVKCPRYPESERRAYVARRRSTHSRGTQPTADEMETGLIVPRFNRAVTRVGLSKRRHTGIDRRITADNVYIDREKGRESNRSYSAPRSRREGTTGTFIAIRAHHAHTRTPPLPSAISSRE